MIIDYYYCYTNGYGLQKSLNVKNAANTIEEIFKNLTISHPGKIRVKELNEFNSNILNNQKQIIIYDFQETEENSVHTGWERL